MSDPEISPSDLKFRFQLGKTLPATINIHNPNAQRLAFKVKTTTPKKYCVKPSSGAVDGHGSTIIQVTMQASKELPADLNNCKDKFLIQTVLLGPGEEPTPEAFKKDNKSVKDTKLRVILEGPPAPPSPVPEAAEGEDEEALKDVKSLAAPAAADSSTTVTPVAAFMNTKESPSVAQPVEKASSTAVYDKLRADYERVERENRDLRSKVDRLQKEARAGGAGAAQAKGAGKVMSLAAEKKVALVQIILVAILAFLIGHFT